MNEGVKQKRQRQQQRLLKKLKYLSRQLVADSNPVASTWNTIFQTIDELVAVHRLAPSNTELRSILLEIVDDMPPDSVPSQPMRLVLRELDRYLDSPAASEDAGTPESINPDIQKVASLLKGRSVVLVGGDQQPDRIAALERAFGAKVVWLGSQEHQSYLRFVAASTRDDVAVVLLAIRWVSHSYGELESACRKAGKPFVRLPRGLNPNMVAHENLKQVGKQLK